MNGFGIRCPETAPDRGLESDVLVVGAGPAGIAASVAAARAGASVVLLEKYGFPGGLASTAMVGSICGLYLRDTANGARYVCGGFAREWAEEVSGAFDSRPVHVASGLYVLPCGAWDMRRAALEFIKNTPRISLSLHTAMTCVEAYGGRVTSVDALSGGRRVTYAPSSVVDCTGEATVS